MKRMIRLFFAALAALSIGAVTACKSAEPYAAKVNGNVLSKTGLDRELNAMRGNDAYFKALQQANVPVEGKGEGTFDQTFVAQVLMRRIYYELVHEEFVERHLKVTAADLQRARADLASEVGDQKVVDAFPADYLKEIVRSSAEVAVLQNALAKATDANLRRYYDDHLDQYEKVCAAHILVETKAQADDVEKTLAKAKDKKATFADLAKKRSKDEGSGANGGDLGCASPAGYVAEFKQAVRTQKVGIIGQPVKTQFGYHIIRVDSRDPAPPYAQVKDQVRQAMTDSQQGPFNEFLQNASTKADVEVNPRYGTYDTTGDRPQIVPPKAPAAAANANGD
jgi:parvulin-like peptidyl-prolyl isomerase